RGQKAAIAHELLAEGERTPSRGPAIWQRRLVGGFAAVAVAALLAVGLNHDRVTAPGTFVAQYSTPHGENRNFVLPDGTSVTLGADSVLSVHYRPDTRSLDLVSGEAFFKVTHDSNRPFVVQVGVARIEDLGTEFDVRRDSE